MRDSAFPLEDFLTTKGLPQAASFGKLYFQLKYLTLAVEGAEWPGESLRAVFDQGLAAALRLGLAIGDSGAQLASGGIESSAQWLLGGPIIPAYRSFINRVGVDEFLAKVA